MVFEFSTLGFWLTPWELSRYSLGFMGLCVKRVFVTVPHAALRLVLCALRCFALHALRSARCVGSAFPRCAIGGESFEDACNKVKHGAIPCVG